MKLRQLLFVVALPALCLFVAGYSGAGAQLALVQIATADRDMTVSTGFCRPLSNSSVGADNGEHAAFVFDTAALPSGAVVTSAVLQLYPANSQSHPVRVYAPADVDLSLGYNCIPAELSTPFVEWSLPSTGDAYIQSPSISGLLETITETVSIVLAVGEEDVGVPKLFRSVTYGEGTAPKLVLEYYVPTPPPPYLTPTPVPFEIPGPPGGISQTIIGIPPLPDVFTYTPNLDLPEIEFGWTLTETAWLVGLFRFIPSILTGSILWPFVLWSTAVLVSVKILIRFATTRDADSAANLPPPNKRD